MQEPVSFTSQGYRLFADLHLPGDNAPCVLMSHGLESSKDGIKWLALTPRLYQQGYAVFRFNYRGCGQGKDKSQGEFEDTTLTSHARDYQAALDFLQGTRVDAARIGVVASSFGGMVALAAGDPRVKALVLLATALEFPLLSAEQLDITAQRGYIQLPSGQRLKPAFFHDLSRHNLREKAGHLTCPVLIIHGGRDGLVPVSHAHELYSLARGPKRLEVIPDGDHSLTRPQHLERIIALTLDWFRQHL